MVKRYSSPRIRCYGALGVPFGTRGEEVMKKYLVVTYNNYEGTFARFIVNAANRGEAILAALEIEEDFWPEILDCHNPQSIAASAEAYSFDCDLPSTAIELDDTGRILDLIASK